MRNLVGEACSFHSTKHIPNAGIALLHNNFIPKQKKSRWQLHHWIVHLIGIYAFFFKFQTIWGYLSYEPLNIIIA